MLKKTASGVLTSKASSTETRPPHHSAARTNVVLLIRRTVRPRGYASGLPSAAALPTVFLSILPECSSHIPDVQIIDVLLCQNCFSANC